jgi:hypothetical protein
VAASPTQVPAATEALEVRVAASDSDAEEGGLGVVTLTDATLDLGGLYRLTGLRFANLTIPKGAPITRAYIEFAADGQDTAPTTFTIEGVASDNAPAFTTAPFNLMLTNTYSTPKVNWVVDYPWVTVDQVHQTAELKSIVQKIVDRSGWAPGNAMAFIISNNDDVFRKAKSWNADPNKAPKLRVEYTVNAIDVRVSASSDDLYQGYFGASATTYNGDTLQFGNSSYYYPGLRFKNVNIPQGAVINYACIKFTAKQDRPAETGYVRIQGEKRLSPPTFTTANTYADPSVIYRRNNNTPVPKTVYASWSGLPAWTAGQVYTSVDIKSVVQDIVGQTGWDSSDKSMVFHLGPGGGTLTRYAWTFDNPDPNKAPLLHIEYGQAGGGASGPAIITLSNTELGRSCFEGTNPESQRFDLINSGATTMNYTSEVIYSKGTGWLVLNPLPGSGTLGPGEEKNYIVSFNTTGLTAGTYEAFIRFTDPNALYSPAEVRVSLAIMPQGKIQCGDIPLYTQNISSPAVMILLDLSGSMTWEMDLVKETDVLPETPNLSPVVQEIVNRDGWKPGNALTFIIEKVSGTGYRLARSFDGYNPSKPVFTVSYDDGGEIKTHQTSVMRSTDDGDAFSAIPYNATGGTLRLAQGGNGYGAAIRFDALPIPKGATVTDAKIRFVPYQTLSDPVTVKIRAHASDNSPTFSTAAYPQLFESARPRTAAQVDWAMDPWTGVTVETKINVAKTVISELVKDTGISWGFGSWANDYLSYYRPELDYTLVHAGCNPHTAEHQAKLQAAVAGLSTYSSTPFGPSILGGKKYFNKEKAEWDPIVNAEVGVKFQDASCQPKFLIEVTDGMGNVPSTTDTGLYNEAYNTWYKNLVATNVNATADAGVSVIGVGFGLPEGEDEQLYVLADVANTRGKASTSDSLYAMHQEDASGKARPYMAETKDQLIDAFRIIMNQVKGAVFFGSAPAATTSTDLGDMVLLASFNAGNWTGDLQAVTKDTNGKWSASLWKASENVPVNRSVWTVDDSNSAIAYTSSTLAGDNYLCKKIGDIIHSTPMVVGDPPFYYSFDNYASFKRNLSVTNPRKKMAYVGSNDGLLHAFSLEDGSEKWAFLPKSLQAKLNEAANGASYDMCSFSYCHRYLMDGSPQVADVYGYFGGDTKKWRTMLLVGQRGGGTAYTALDVTSGESFGAGTDPAKFLWELTDADMGESWADAAIERVSHGANASAWGVFVSSGYHENDNLQYNKEAYLYGVEADTGNGLWSDGQNTINKIKPTTEKKSLGYKNLATENFVAGEVVTGQTSGAKGKITSIMISPDLTGTLFLVEVSGTFSNNEQIEGSAGHRALANGTLALVEVGQKNNALSSPVTANFYAQDRIEDCLYAGDLYGTMYRVDSIGKGQTPSVSKLFKFNPYPSGPDERPIRGKASIAYNQGSNGLWVYYGTGRYETAADKVNNQQQYFFGLKDAQTPRATPYSLADLTTHEARFTTATIGGTTLKLRTINGTNAGSSPWAMKLFAGQSTWGGPTLVGGSERVFTKPLAVGGIVFFTTFLPDADICTGSGDTYVFALDYKTGLPPAKPVFDINGDGKFNDADKVLVNGSLVVPIGVYVGRGQGSAPVLFKDTLFVTTSTPQYQLDGSAGSGDVTGLNAFLVNIPQKKIRVESWKHN